MFFSDLDDLKAIAARVQFSIFVLPADVIEQNRQALSATDPTASTRKAAKSSATRKVATSSASIPKTGACKIITPSVCLPHFPLALNIQPDPKRGKIYIDQVRAVTDKLNTRQTSDFYVIFWQADTLNEAAQNAFLKNLEEPGDHYHFIFYTAHPSALLPTVLSRGQIFYWQEPGRDLVAPPTADAKTLELAKKLIAARRADLPTLADTFQKKPADTRRAYTLGVLAVCIEILQKSYLKTGNAQFLPKLTKFLHLYENIAAGGHVKLHLVADLL